MKPRYTLAIDEEGFPLFDGLRVDDAGLLKALLGNLKYSDPTVPRSALVTTCDGETVWVDSFDVPLVAQDVEWVRESLALPAHMEWIFPAGIKRTVKVDQLREDEWHRIHARVQWSSELILDAVCTRKAQARLLGEAPTLPKSIPSLLEGLSPDQKKVVSATFWDELYAAGQTGWDLGQEHPTLKKNLDSLRLRLKVDSKILVPGCGRGHDALALARTGLRVSVVDFSSLALAELTKRATKENLKIEVINGDVFEVLASGQKWDAIFEHTIFCAINPSERARYVAGVLDSLNSGGLWFGLYFLKPYSGGPPFGLTQWELRQRLRDRNVAVLDWTLSFDLDSRSGQELWATFQKET